MKKIGLAKKIGRRPWSLFIRNIPPFFTCKTYFNQEKKSDKCAITESDDL